MLRLKEGDAVQIVKRGVTSADAKSGLYYGYYGGLTGVVFKLYGSGESAQAAVDVDLESLPEEVAKRHLETRDRMRETLTGDAKRQSGPGGEQEFRLRYVILVGVADLTRKLATKLRETAHASG